MQRLGLGLERIRKRLCPPPVIDPHKDIVGKGKADGGASESPRQPAVSVAIELQSEGTIAKIFCTSVDRNSFECGPRHGS
jgi:hypothetical protein